MTLPVIAQELSHASGRVVINKTNLPGRFDIDLRWLPDDEPPVRLNGDELNLPSIFTALQGATPAFASSKRREAQSMSSSSTTSTSRQRIRPYFPAVE